MAYRSSIPPKGVNPSQTNNNNNSSSSKPLPSAKPTPTSFVGTKYTSSPGTRGSTAGGGGISTGVGAKRRPESPSAGTHLGGYSKAAQARMRDYSGSPPEPTTATRPSTAYSHQPTSKGRSNARMGTSSSHAPASKTSTAVSVPSQQQVYHSKSLYVPGVVQNSHSKNVNSASPHSHLGGSFGEDVGGENPSFYDDRYLSGDELFVSNNNNSPRTNSGSSPLVDQASNSLYLDRRRNDDSSNSRRSGEAVGYGSYGMPAARQQFQQQQQYYSQQGQMQQMTSNSVPPVQVEEVTSYNDQYLQNNNFEIPEQRQQPVPRNPAMMSQAASISTHGQQQQQQQHQVYSSSTVQRSRSPPSTLHQDPMITETQQPPSFGHGGSVSRDYMNAPQSKQRNPPAGRGGSRGGGSRRGFAEQEYGLSSDALGPPQPTSTLPAPSSFGGGFGSAPPRAPAASSSAPAPFFGDVPSGRSGGSRYEAPPFTETVVEATNYDRAAQAQGGAVTGAGVAKVVTTRKGKTPADPRLQEAIQAEVAAKIGARVDKIKARTVERSKAASGTHKYQTNDNSSFGADEEESMPPVGALPPKRTSSTLADNNNDSSTFGKYSSPSSSSSPNFPNSGVESTVTSMERVGSANFLKAYAPPDDESDGGEEGSFASPIQQRRDRQEIRAEARDAREMARASARVEKEEKLRVRAEEKDRAQKEKEMKKREKLVLNKKPSTAVPSQQGVDTAESNNFKPLEDQLYESPTSSLSETREESSRFQILRHLKLGAGGFGKVYKAFDSQTGGYAAVKESVFSSMSSTAIDQLKQEYKVLCGLQHPNIVRVDEFVINKEGSKAQIFMELMSSGSVSDVLSNNRFRLPEATIRNYMAGALQGLAYLHGKGMIHRDVKPGNMLVGEGGKIKLSDFGTSKMTQNETTAATTGIVGTSAFMAAESLTMGKYSSSSDIWSLACSVVEMGSGLPPWSELPLEKRSPMPLMFHIGTAQPPNHHPKIPSHLSVELQNILKSMMAHSKETRPQAEDILRSQYFTRKGLPSDAESMQEFSAKRNGVFTAVAPDNSLASLDKGSSVATSVSAGGGGGAGATSGSSGYQANTSSAGSTHSFMDTNEAISLGGLGFPSSTTTSVGINRDHIFGASSERTTEETRTSGVTHSTSSMTALPSNETFSDKTGDLSNHREVLEAMLVLKKHYSARRLQKFFGNVIQNKKNEAARKIQKIFRKKWHKPGGPVVGARANVGLRSPTIGAAGGRFSSYSGVGMSAEPSFDYTKSAPTPTVGSYSSSSVTTGSNISTTSKKKKKTAVPTML